MTTVSRPWGGLHSGGPSSTSAAWACQLAVGQRRCLGHNGRDGTRPSKTAQWSPAAPSSTARHGPPKPHSGRRQHRVACTARPAGGPSSTSAAWACQLAVGQRRCLGHSGRDGTRPSKTAPRPPAAPSCTQGTALQNRTVAAGGAELHARHGPLEGRVPPRPLGPASSQSDSGVAWGTMAGMEPGPPKPHCGRRRRRVTRQGTACWRAEFHLGRLGLPARRLRRGGPRHSPRRSSCDRQLPPLPRRQVAQ